MIGETVVGWLSNNLLALLPFRVVRSYQRGVRFRLGRDIALLSPGWWWFFPVVESIEVVDVAPCVMNLPTQSVTTCDGRALSFSANIEYEIVNARKMYVRVQHLDTSLSASAMGFLAETVRAQPWDALVAGQLALEGELRRTITKQARRWGVRIRRVHLTDFVTTRALRLYGDNAPLHW